MSFTPGCRLSCIAPKAACVAMRLIYAFLLLCVLSTRVASTLDQLCLLVKVVAVVAQRCLDIVRGSGLQGLLQRLLPKLLLVLLRCLSRRLLPASLSRLLRLMATVRLAPMSIVGAPVVVARVAKVVPLRRRRGRQLLMGGPSA